MLVTTCMTIVHALLTYGRNLKSIQKGRTTSLWLSSLLYDSEHTQDNITYLQHSLNISVLFLKQYYINIQTKIHTLTSDGKSCSILETQSWYSVMSIFCFEQNHSVLHTAYYTFSTLNVYHNVSSGMQIMIWEFKGINSNIVHCFKATQHNNTLMWIPMKVQF